MLSPKQIHDIRRLPKLIENGLRNKSSLKDALRVSKRLARQVSTPERHAMRKSPKIVFNNVGGDGNCFFYAIYGALLAKNKDFPYLQYLSNCGHGEIDVSEPKRFAASMREVIAKAFNSKLSEKINEFTNQVALFFYEMGEDEANAYTCIPLNKTELGFERYKMENSGMLLIHRVGLYSHF